MYEEYRRRVDIIKSTISNITNKIDTLKKQISRDFTISKR